MACALFLPLPPHFSHSTLSPTMPTMAKAPVPPAPVLPLLPSDHSIVLPINNNIVICILQGVIKTRSHIPPTGRWADLERLLWELELPAPGPFHSRFKQWLEAQWSRNIKDRIVSLLTFHGDYDPKVRTNLSQLEMIAKHLKEEMHASKGKAARRSALDAKRLHQEAYGHKNLCQEGALGAFPQGYGVRALRVASANEACQLQNQDTCDLLACNPRLQNNHLHPIMVGGGPPCPPDRTIVTPIPPVPVIAMGDGGAVLGQPITVQVQKQQQPPLQLPTLGKFATMDVPPPAPNTGAMLPAALSAWLWKNGAHFIRATVRMPFAKVFSLLKRSQLYALLRVTLTPTLTNFGSFYKHSTAYNAALGIGTA